MKSYLSVVPVEIFLQVLCYLPNRDKLCLSSTCKSFRATLAPDVFKTLRVATNASPSTTKGGLSAAESALAAVKIYGEYTEKIEFICNSDAGQRDKSDPSAKRPALSAAAAKLLSGEHTPNLRTVQLRFDFNLSDGKAWDNNPLAPRHDSIWAFFTPEPEAGIKAKEQEFVWRALINETWQALSKNTNVKNLVVDGFIPKWASAYRTKEFRQFLSRLESASISIWGEDGPSDPNVPGEETTGFVDGYRYFFDEFDALFFRHMSNLKHLRIDASEFGPMGEHISFGLMPKDLPKLETLKLANSFVNQEVVSFVQSHANTLVSLDVDACFCSSADGPNPDRRITSWRQFFDSIHAAQPSLVELIVGDTYVPLDETEEDPDGGYTPRIPAEKLNEIRLRLEVEPSLKVFGYRCLDYSDGEFMLDCEQNLEMFRQGLDQEAYNRLMKYVYENEAVASMDATGKQMAALTCR